MSQTPDPAKPAASAPPASTDVAPSYEAALDELERLVARLDAGQLPLEDLLVHYQRGAALLAFCRERLAKVEQQVQVLDANGLKPWSEA